MTEQTAQGDLLAMNMRTEDCFKLRGNAISWFREREMQDSFQVDLDKGAERLTEGGFIIPIKFDEARLVFWELNPRHHCLGRMLFIQ